MISRGANLLDELTECGITYGSADWVVGFFPKLFELPGLSVLNPDLGSAGFTGFLDGRVKDYDTQFIQGGHGAALIHQNVQSIVDFILRWIQD